MHGPCLETLLGATDAHRDGGSSSVVHKSLPRTVTVISTCNTPIEVRLEMR